MTAAPAPPPLFLYPKMCIRCGELISRSAGSYLSIADNQGCAALHFSCALQVPEQAVQFVQSSGSSDGRDIQMLVQLVRQRSSVAVPAMPAPSTATIRPYHALLSTRPAIAPPNATTTALFPGYLTCIAPPQRMTIEQIFSTYPNVTTADLVHTGLDHAHFGSFYNAYNRSFIEILVRHGLTREQLIAWQFRISPEDLHLVPSVAQRR